MSYALLLLFYCFLLSKVCYANMSKAVSQSIIIRRAWYVSWLWVVFGRLRALRCISAYQRMLHHLLSPSFFAMMISGIFFACLRTWRRYSSAVAGSCCVSATSEPLLSSSGNGSACLGSISSSSTSSRCITTRDIFCLFLIQFPAKAKAGRKCHAKPMKSRTAHEAPKRAHTRVPLRSIPSSFYFFFLFLPRSRALLWSVRLICRQEL